MKKILSYLKENVYILIVVLICINLMHGCNSCNRENKSLDIQKKVSTNLDYINSNIMTHKEFKKELMLEGLRSEKRMIQSVDRKLWDLHRQREIDKQIDSLQNIK